ncbi:ankyrin repeat domain-containing protein [Fodinicola acaciae]|uniref:ankyrin repeat domain-containing protein n=1 Tax=Fodinicola acaciae TaxID=2681555 RepID=UPI0013D4764A|nr:ankyrin repeat domain-containing protein [Fodinicola acaciae]
MPTVPLPDNPNLEHLRKRARELQRAVRARDPQALATIAEHRLAPENFQLSTAQLAIARHYGFASWPRLTRHLAIVGTYARDPQTSPATGDVADDFCRLACLIYTDEDGPERWSRARQLLAEHPDLPRRSIWAAAAAGDPVAMREHLARTPADEQGGPFRWGPLFTLAYARVGGDALATARLLLDAGADPNAGYLWKGLPSPFTVLTGAFGEGEQGRGRQPRHPRSIELATMLLDAGAEPNDGQGLYNRMFHADDSHLELLFARGLGGGDGGVWKARLGEAMQSPAEMLRYQLQWAVRHGFTARVRLLAEHGVDVSAPIDGRTPAQLAAAEGHRDIVDLLVSLGAPRPAMAPSEQLVAALLAGDRSALKSDLLADVRRSQPGLVVRAQRPELVAFLVEAGFDVDGRHEGHTALHDAAWRGDVPMIEALLAAGADRSVRDDRFDATPLGWAEHGCQPAAIDALGL